MEAMTARFDTGQLGPLREMVNKLAAHKVAITGIVQFSVVVDVNMVVPDLVYRVRFPERGATALEELIRSTVVVAHAPRWLDIEMMSAIPRVSRQYKLPAEALLARWGEFQTLIVWDETLREPGVVGNECCDPKDLPYVLLERKLQADGILTRDRHMARMGGHPLTLDFVLSTRNYAREVVKTVTLRVAGIVVPVASLVILSGVLRGIGKGVAALPPSVKALLVAIGLVALAHPGSRQWLVERCVDVGAALASAGSSLIEMVSLLMAMDREADAKAREHLISASSLVKPKTRWARRQRRVTRARRVRPAGAIAPTRPGVYSSSS
jgi:hypothetical protein